ncbi:hypothetical protein Pan44_21290 [Caulifigura coniformis]|uniref:Uncharacterized protein n=1 Tax=Caulifigura coniformis TaxID=2527983 RepID=A0A517SDA1_9PLAN|nr:hypothetical protein [Caulifigura coniformis]QDT54102.1 hypothetical protein Pan44_21290 [Caulifigura coniformis]
MESIVDLCVLFLLSWPLLPFMTLVATGLIMVAFRVLAALRDIRW